MRVHGLGGEEPRRHCASHRAVGPRQVCPHIIGGIPPIVVDKVFTMMRDGPAFVRIEGLTE